MLVLDQVADDRPTSLPACPGHDDLHAKSPPAESEGMDELPVLVTMNTSAGTGDAVSSNRIFTGSKRLSNALAVWLPGLGEDLSRSTEKGVQEP